MCCTNNECKETIARLTAQLATVTAERDAERGRADANFEKLEEKTWELAAVTECLNGSSKAKYTAEMYDALRTALAQRTAEMARVVKAASAVVWYDWSDNDPDAVSAIDALANALVGVEVPHDAE